MSDKMRYELNGVEIDCNKNWNNQYYKELSLSSDRFLIMLNAGFHLFRIYCEYTIVIGYFNFCVPLNMLFDFCKDYRHMIVNTRYKLILRRACNNNNCLVGDPVMGVGT